MARDDDLTNVNQNPIQRDDEGGQEPRHDAAKLTDFSKPAIIRELLRVQNGQGVALTRNATKQNAVTQLLGPLYDPCLPALRSRCRDLGLAQDGPAYTLRRALDRRHHEDRHIPVSQVWRPKDLRQLCEFRGIGSLDDHASLLYQLLKYELQAAQDRHQQNTRCELDWRLMHYQDPSYFPAPLSPDIEAAYRTLHPHRQYPLWSEDYIGNGSPSFVAPTTEQERMEVELENKPRLSEFEGHPDEVWDQLLPLKGLRDVQWRGMKTLFRSFALAFLDDESEWRTVQAAVQTLWSRAMDARQALVPGSGQINELARHRRLLYERLDASTRRQGERGRLLDQLFDWRVEGTMEMVQLLADAYDVEILVHIPHHVVDPANPEASKSKWKVLSRGFSSNRRQINLINYSSINRWTVARSIFCFNYIAHLTIDCTNSFHRRPVLEDPLLPHALPRDDSPTNDHRPNYILGLQNRNEASSDQTRHSDPSGDLYFTGGTGRPTTTEDYFLIQRVRREAEELESAHRSTDDGRGIERVLHHRLVEDGELGLFRSAHLQGLRFHPEIKFRQYYVGGSLESGTCLLRAFARAYFGTEKACARVGNDAVRIIGLAGLDPGAQQDTEIHFTRNDLYRRLDDELHRNGCGSLLEQAMSCAMGTDSLVQVLADVYGVEIFIHTPYIDIESGEPNWGLIIRGDDQPIREHQVHLVNYRQLREWTCLRPRNGARYTNHKASEEYDQLRGFQVENGFETAPRLRREVRRDWGPNYRLAPDPTVNDDESGSSSSSSSSTSRHSKRRRSESDSDSSSPPGDSKRQRSSSESSPDESGSLSVPDAQPRSQIYDRSRLLSDEETNAVWTTGRVRLEVEDILERRDSDSRGERSLSEEVRRLREFPVLRQLSREDENGSCHRFDRSIPPTLLHGLTPQDQAIRRRQFDSVLHGMIRTFALEGMDRIRSPPPELENRLEFVLRERLGVRRPSHTISLGYEALSYDNGNDDNLTQEQREHRSAMFRIYEIIIQDRLERALGLEPTFERDFVARLEEGNDEQGDDAEDSQDQPNSMLTGTPSSSPSSGSQDVGSAQESDAQASDAQASDAQESDALASPS